PPQEKLYFRGSTLYLEKKNSWKKLNHLSKERLSNLNDLIEYEMIIYPHGEKWIYALDIPIKELEKTKLKADYTLESQKEIYSKKRYSLSSALNYKLTSKNVNDALKVDRAEYPKMVKFLEPIARKNLRAEEKSKELIEFFKKQKLAYKVNPKGLNIEHIAESFLFEAKEGYCTHFASSFAIASRILGIPSRVVTGFKANDTGRVENYLLVRQKDAHAWVELYFEEKGWTRFEPTATAVVNLGIQEEGRENAGKKWFEEINLQYMYLKYLVNKWVLGFDRLKQMAILESLLNDTIYLLKFLFTLLGVVLFSLMLFYFIRNSKSGDKGQKLMQKLLQRLEKRGVHKKNSEPMELFLQRVEIELGVSLKNISKYYHQYKYANKKETLEFLEKEIKTMMRTIA
ncbi:MAG: transglutaminaseTgpA domain-containing protein, partial [Campylobacterota bacterium]